MDLKSAIDIKEALDEMECLIPKKRKHITHFDARWIYQLQDTDIYLVYLSGLRHSPVYDYRNGRYIYTVYGWMWYKVTKDYCGQIKSSERIDFHQVLDEATVPTEVLFHIDELSKLKASDEKNNC